MPKVNCATREEVDQLWLKDQFGLWWQIIPSALGKLMNDPDPEKSVAVSQAMLKMNKIVIEDLEKAYAAA